MKIQLFLYKSENQEPFNFNCHNTARTHTFEQHNRQLRNFHDNTHYFHNNTPWTRTPEYDVLSLERNDSNFTFLEIEDDVPSHERALQLLHENDANFKFVKIMNVIEHYNRNETALSSREDFERVGRAIAKNTTVENLKIDLGKDLDIEMGHLHCLFEEMTRNRSLRRFELKNLRVIMPPKNYLPLTSFLEKNPSLETFLMSNCHVYLAVLRRLMTGLTSRGAPLDAIAMNDCKLDDEDMKEITSFFKDKPAMTPNKLSLDNNRNTDVGCSFLSELICNNDCKLEEISLRKIPRIGLHGILSIVSASASRKDHLKKFCFTLADVVRTDNDLREFVEIFSSHPDLLPIDLEFEENHHCKDVLQAMGNMLARRSSPIEHFSLNLLSAEPDGIPALFRAFLVNPTATPRNIYITCRALERENAGDLHLDLSELLRSHSCSLEMLHLSGIGQISEDAMVNIASTLQGNSTLKSLRIDAKGLTARVLNLLSTLLCDKTTIPFTYNSNHTLRCIKINDWMDETICSYLELNKIYPEKGLVATAKIIEYHFAHNFQLGNFDSMGASLLAQIVSYVNRGFQVCNKAFCKERLGRNVDGDRKNNNLTVNFLMVRNIPAFFYYIPAHPTRSGHKPPPPSPHIGEVSNRISKPYSFRRLAVGVMTRMRRSRKRGVQSSGC